MRDNDSTTNASRHEFFYMALSTMIFIGLALLPRLF
jgi:hypothetical protein